MFVAFISSTGMARLYDPLNPDTNAYGRIVPASILWPFLASWGYSTILWYRDGTTAWEKAGYPVEDRKPVPRPQ